MPHRLIVGVMLMALAACGAGAAPASQTASGGSMAPLRFGINGGVPSSTFVWLMGDAGVFKKNGLNVELRGMNGQAQTTAMVAGDIDAEMHAGIALVLSAAAQGSAFKIVAVMQPVYDLELLVANDVTAPEQLKGRKIGSQTWTSANSMATRHYLSQHGLELDRDYGFVATGSAGSEPGMVAQLLSRQVDAIAVTPSAAEPVLAQGGYHVLIDFAKANVRVASQAVIVQAPYAQQHPDIVQTLVDTMIEGVRYFREHKAEAETAMRVHFKLTDQAVMDNLFERQSQVLTNLPTVAKADFADVVASMPSDGPQISDDKLSAMLDNHFVEDAARRGLTNF